MLIREEDDRNDEEGEEAAPYWDDAVDKYFDRPDHETFDDVTYPDYFKNYTIRSKPPGPNSRGCPRRGIEKTE